MLFNVKYTKFFTLITKRKPTQKNAQARNRKQALDVIVLMLYCSNAKVHIRHPA